MDNQQKEDFNADETFYMCSRCKSHIVKESDFIHRIDQNGVFTGFCVFQNLVNVNYSNLPNENRMQRVHCMSCNRQLGFRFVEVPAARLCFIVQNGRSKLTLDRLSYWNGNQQQSGYAPILRELKPVPEPLFILVPEPPLDAESDELKPSGPAPPRAECDICKQKFQNNQALGSHKYHAHNKRKAASESELAVQKIRRSSVRIEERQSGGTEVGAQIATSEIGAQSGGTVTLFGVSIGAKEGCGTSLHRSLGAADGMERQPGVNDQYCPSCGSQFDTDESFLGHTCFS